ncbi:MAG: hypothetical protein ACETV1_04005, partial [Candidatus Bathyarchaeia archaeon]
GRYLRHFSRSYNVRWFIGCETPGLTRTNPESPYELYEVAGFNSSFTEIVKANSILVLFVGEKQEYSWFFTSIALSDREDVVPVYGGNSLDEYDVATFKNFDVVYLSGLRSGDFPDLSEYVEDGGCLILDTGTVDGEDGIADLPSPFPIEAITYEESYLMLNSATPHEITENVDFAMFRMERPFTVSHAGPVKNGASVILYDGDKPILVHWRQGLGKVFWTGFGLPYLVMLHEDYEAKSGEEARLLLNLLRQAESSGINASKGAAIFEQKCLEEIVAYVRDASPRDALWLKMSYYPGWTAQIEGEGQAMLRIFTAGPNMMLVFPMRSGDYTVRFYFDKTTDVKVGELVSSLTMVALLIAAFYKAALAQKRTINTKTFR